MPYMFSYVVMARDTWMSWVKMSMEIQTSCSVIQTARRRLYVSELNILQIRGPRKVQLSEALAETNRIQCTEKLRSTEYHFQSKHKRFANESNLSAIWEIKEVLSRP